MKLKPITTGVLGFIVTLPAFWLSIPKINQANVDQEIQEALPVEISFQYRDLPPGRDAVAFLVERYEPDLFRDKPREELPRRQELEQLTQLNDMEFALRSNRDKRIDQVRIGFSCRYAFNDLWELAAYQANEGNLDAAKRTLKTSHRLEQFALNFPHYYSMMSPPTKLPSAPFLEVLGQQPQTPSTIQLFLTETQNRPNITLSEAFVIDARHQAMISEEWDSVRQLPAAENQLKISRHVKANHLEAEQFFRRSRNLKIDLELSPSGMTGIYEQTFYDHWLYENGRNATESALLDALGQPPVADLCTSSGLFQVRKENGTTTLWSVGFDLTDNDGDDRKDHVLTFPTIKVVQVAQ